MSDSNIGARKNKNVRNHVWIVNGVLNEVLSGKQSHNIDIQILDYQQCFDSLWLQACLNDAYESGIQDDSLTLLYNVNKSVNIAVRTPVGQTERRTIPNVVMQGDILPNSRSNQNQFQSNQKSGEALNLGSCLLFVVCCLFVVCRNAGYNLLIPF